MTYMQIQEYRYIHADTNALHRYRADTIRYIQIHEFLYAVYIRLHIPVCVMHVHVWCMYSTFKKGHTYKIHTRYRTYINPYVLYLVCIWCFWVYVCACMCIYVVHMMCIFLCSVLYCMYLPVFFAANFVSREICTTYRQYAHIHTNKAKIQQTYIQIHTKIHANTCNNTYIKQVYKKCICCLLSATIFACISLASSKACNGPCNACNYVHYLLLVMAT